MGLIEFDLDLTLEEKYNDNLRFILVLNNSDYDEFNTWDYSVRGFKYYIENLTLNGVFKSYNQNGNCFEILYEDGKEKWKKNYWPNGKLKDSNEGGISKEFNSDGNLVKEYEGSKWNREYNKNGQLIEEVEGDKFKVYNDNIDVIDSNEIKVTYNQVSDEYDKLINEYNLINEETNTIIENDFCIDIHNGECLRVCFMKDDEFIWRAFKILHYKYLKSWKFYEETLDNAIKKFPEGSLKWNSNIQFLEKIGFMQAYIVYFQSNIELIHNFNTTIGKFRDLLESPDIKKINK